MTVVKTIDHRSHQRSRRHTVPGITVLLPSFIGVQVERQLVRRQGLSDDREHIIRHKARATPVLCPFPSDLQSNRLGELRQRLPKRALYTFCAAACLPARRPPTTHRAMPCSPNPPADSPAQ